MRIAAVHTEPDVPESERWPLRTRVAILLALTAFCWLVIILAVPALVAAPDAALTIISKFVSHRGE